MCDTTKACSNGSSDNPSNGSSENSTPEATTSAPQKTSLINSLRNFRYTPIPKPTSTNTNASTSSSIIIDLKRKLNTEIDKETTILPNKRDKINDDNNTSDNTNGVKLQIKSSAQSIFEKSIKCVQDNFPTKSRDEIEAALRATNWNVNKASDKLKNGAVKKTYPPAVRKLLPEEINALVKGLDSKNRVKTDMKKSEVATVTNQLSTMKSDKTKALKQMSQLSKPPATSSPLPLPTQKQSHESSDDDDEYSSFARTKRHKILGYLTKANMPELLAISGCSVPKAEIIRSLQPFKNWKQLNNKLTENKKINLNISIFYENVLETIRLQNEISILMRNCTDLSYSMNQKISKLSQYREENIMSLGQQPKSLAPDLKLAPYQMIGLGWLRLIHEEEVNGILADEMGLGKTIQIIAFLAYLKENSLQNEVHLIIVPSSTIENWSNELKKWCPSLHVQIYHGSQEDRKVFQNWWRNAANIEEVGNTDIILTTYKLLELKQDRGFFRTMKLQYIIYDEAHCLKNMATQRFQHLMRIDGDHRVLLTGTPLQNNLVELMSLLVFVMPQMFAHKQHDLIKLFKTSPKGASDRETSEFESEKINQAKKIMEPFLLRRLKSDVLKDLPPKTEEIIVCEMTEQQNALYAQALEELQEESKVEKEKKEEKEDEQDDEEVEDNELDEDDDEKSEEKPEETESYGLSGSMGIMMRLRRIANHAALIRSKYSDTTVRKIAKKLKSDKTYKETNMDKILDLFLCDYSDHQIHKLCCEYKSIKQFKLKANLNYVMESGKIQKLDELLPVLKSNGHRVLLFSQFKLVMDYLEDYCDLREYKYVRLDGSTPVVERQSMVDEYNKDDSIFIFLLSTKAGGFGINLASADTVIIHDIDLNPYNDKQAEDRCHRVGQVRPVRVIRMVSQSTIEQTMLKIAQSKLSLEQQISQGRHGKKSEIKLMQLLKEELKINHT